MSDVIARAKALLERLLPRLSESDERDLRALLAEAERLTSDLLAEYKSHDATKAECGRQFNRILALEAELAEQVSYGEQQLSNTIVEIQRREALEAENAELRKQVARGEDPEGL